MQAVDVDRNEVEAIVCCSIDTLNDAGSRTVVVAERHKLSKKGIISLTGRTIVAADVRRTVHCSLPVEHAIEAISDILGDWFGQLDRVVERVAPRRCIVDAKYHFYVFPRRPRMRS